MEYLSGSIILILLIATAVSGIKLHYIKKDTREISKQLKEKLSDDTNTLIKISSSDKDIKKLASDLNKQLKLLRTEYIRCQQGDRKLKETLTNISHDLRTPLTAVCGYLELLRKENCSEKTEKYLDVIYKRIDVIKQLTDQLLKYSIVVSQEQQLHLEDIIINDVLEESIVAFYAVITEKEIMPVIEICEEKIHRQLDKNALSRIFSNIISNAVRYSSGDLKISLTGNGNITFSNTAKQLDEISVNRLSDRFYTVENAGKTTGLGLYIAKLLTEQMGGKIDIRYLNDSLIIEIIF